MKALGATPDRVRTDAIDHVAEDRIDAFQMGDGVTRIRWNYILLHGNCDQDD